MVGMQEVGVNSYICLGGDMPSLYDDTMCDHDSSES